MARPYYLDRPDMLELEAEVLDVRADGILLDCSPLFPGGGGQLPDRGKIIWSGGELEIKKVTSEARGVWHEVCGPAEPSGSVLIQVDRSFRSLMSEMHTVAHIVNSIVFRDFDRALLTGAQLAGDGSFRLDFDLPGADNDRLRALEGPINDAIRLNLTVQTTYMPWAEADAEPGIFRSKAVTPPQMDDGTVRIVEIVGFDRQACGGTHLASTGHSRPVKILKIDNKGRQNRRVRVGLVGVTY
jgi:misacylated tRNA(Ala) deacylase